MRVHWDPNPTFVRLPAYKPDASPEEQAAAEQQMRGVLMPRYSGWTTVIDGASKKHRSENATYAWLREQAETLPEGTLIEVQVTEPPNTKVSTFEKLRVRGGKLGDE